MATLILLGLFIPMANRVVLSGVDLNAHRLLVLMGLLRLAFRHEGQGFTFNTIDKVVAAMCLWSVFAYTALWGTVGSFIYQMGRTLDIMGLYFLFRVFLKEPEDWRWAVRTLAVACAIFAGFMMVEAATGRNLLSVLGGVGEQVGSRKGRFRCQATFGHAISAGVLGASLMPIWLAGWSQENFRKWAILGLASSTLMTLTSASSSSLLTYVAGVGAFFMWPFRHHLRTFRWGVAFLLLALHLVMKAPVWALLGRINVVGGSTGDYRYRLFDNFLRTFDQWWLFGLEDPEAAFGMWDLCNQFVLEGVRGGFLRVALYVAMLVFCFREVGRAIALTDNRRDGLWIWALGCMLFAHFSAFWGYNYWDQIRVALYLVFAATASARVIGHVTAVSQRDGLSGIGLEGGMMKNPTGACYPV